jgi:hypothetical protein
MERIVIEVDEGLARAWRRASDKKKKDIGNKFNISLAQELKRPDDGKIEDYHIFLNELRNDMSAKGLTSEELDKILNDE